MKYIIGCMLVIGITSISAISEAASPGMKDGLWEITMSTEMPGLPFTPPAMTMTHCYTKEDVKKNESVVPKQEGDCKISDIKQSGNKTSWKLTCTGKNAGKGEGEIAFKGDSAYEGFQKLEMKDMNMTTRYKAKRIGNCK